MNDNEEEKGGAPGRGRTRLRWGVVGEKHPDTIWSMADLAATYHAQGRYSEAEPIFQEALDLRREVLGEKHPDTIASMAALSAT
jgi:tetratricopeptide (TPR) repeat protein